MRTLDKFTVQKDSVDTSGSIVYFALVLGNIEVAVFADAAELIEDIEVNVDCDPQNNIMHPHSYNALITGLVEVDCPHDTDLKKGEFIRLTEQQIKDVNNVLYDEAKPV